MAGGSVEEAWVSSGEQHLVLLHDLGLLLVSQTNHLDAAGFANPLAALFSRGDQQGIVQFDIAQSSPQNIGVDLADLLTALGHTDTSGGSAPTVVRTLAHPHNHTGPCRQESCVLAQP